MSRARHKKASGGRVYYSGGGSNVAKEAAEMKRRATAAIGTLGGALEKTLEALNPYLPPPASPLETMAKHAA